MLSARLNPNPSRPRLAVINQGIGCGRLLHDFCGPSGAARFDRDVLSVAGVTGVIVHLGLNDITIPSILPHFGQTGIRRGGGERQRNHRRPAPAHAACTGARGKDLRRHHHAQRFEHRTWRLHAGERGQAPGGQSMDPHVRCIRRRRRFRCRGARSRRIPRGCCPPTISMEPISTTPVIRRWRTRSICRCSSDSLARQ